MTQKIIKVGSSHAVTIPKKSMAELGFKAGGKVSVRIDTEKGEVAFRPAEKKVSKNKFEQRADRFIEKYYDALKELADK